jgi:Spy/CpxP family protein refolding chaperone
MKSPFFLVPVAALTFLLAPSNLPAADLRADGPLPPVPPGSPLPPPLPANFTPAPPSKNNSTQQSTMNSPGLTALSGGQGGQGGQRLQKLKQELGLTPPQVAKIKPILEKAGTQLKASRDNTSLPVPQRRQKMRQIFAASAQQIRPILTPQQLQKWKQIREEHHTATAST